MNKIIILDKAKENIRAAKLCFNNEHYNAAINRAYYAAMQTAISALLTKDTNLPADINHAFLKDQFKQLLTKKYRRYHEAIEELYRYRQDADYSDIRFGKSRAKEMIHSAESIINFTITHYQLS